MPDDIDISTEIHDRLEEKHRARLARFVDNPTPGVCQRCGCNIPQDRVDFYKNFNGVDIETCGQPDCETSSSPNPRSDDDEHTDEQPEAAKRAEQLTTLIDPDDNDDD